MENSEIKCLDFAARLAALPEPETPEALSAIEIAREKLIAEQQQRERYHRWHTLSRRFGVRYAGCTLDNYAVSSKAQADALGLVKGYCDDIAERAKQGVGAMLFGPPGTGKDHLAVCIMRAGLKAGLSVEWTDGAEFYGKVRDNIESNRTESEFLQRFTSPSLLVMSDPLPPKGDLKSEFQLSMLFRVIDRRYRELKATVLTLNVADRAEAEQRLSPNIIDRLAHGALAIHCNWPSFRR